jgi:hypothetical protein
MTKPPPNTVSLDGMLAVARQVLVETGGRGRRWAIVRNALVQMLQMQAEVVRLERRAR